MCFLEKPPRILSHLLMPASHLLRSRSTGSHSLQKPGRNLFSCFSTAASCSWQMIVYKTAFRWKMADPGSKGFSRLLIVTFQITFVTCFERIFKLLTAKILVRKKGIVRVK